MAEIYDTTRFGELYYAARTPPVLNLGLAARYISGVLTSCSIPFAMIGGWAIYLRGSGRRTQDVDVTVATSMEHLKQVLLAEPRICFPATHGQTCVQIFIKTGRSSDVDYPETDDLAVSMDIVISGNLGTPSNLSGACEQIIPQVFTPQGSRAMVLGLFSQVSAKLTAFSDRGGQSDTDFQDLEFLLLTYGAQIFRFNNHLDRAHRHTFAERYATRYAGNADVIHHVRQVLGI